MLGGAFLRSPEAGRARKPTDGSRPMSLFVNPLGPRRTDHTNRVATTAQPADSGGAYSEDIDPGGPQADDRFIETLHTEYSRTLMSMVLRMTDGDRHWAEDVVQETLLRAWRHADALRIGRQARSLMPWLTTVARRIVLNDRRNRGARPHEVDDAVLAGVGVADDTELALQRIIIREALARLTPAHRRV